MESVPISTELIHEGESLRIVGVPEMRDVRMRTMGTPFPASHVVDHILALDPNVIRLHLLRIYPDRLLQQLQNDDICIRLAVSDQTSYMNGELILFLSSSSRFKGFWGWSTRTCSQDDAERLALFRVLFKESVIRENQAAMRAREAVNNQGGKTYLVPSLPLGAEPKSIQTSFDMSEGEDGAVGAGIKQ